MGPGNTNYAIKKTEVEQSELSALKNQAVSNFQTTLERQNEVEHQARIALGISRKGLTIRHR